MLGDVESTQDPQLGLRDTFDPTCLAGPITSPVYTCHAVVTANSVWNFPIALIVFGYEAVKLYKDHKEKMSTGNPESISEASIEWSALHMLFCALCDILGGTVGGLLGSGNKLRMYRSQ
ncbi:hypothetical protein Fmac_030229 [Flemingia macrophylla]|uniref:Uncharacterized protein n=1 Tax=Flemingia macrophylla TaxID=520843 RepID=A0ABD1LE80_9FABA